MGVVDNTRSVRDLFDRKAAGWASKYRRGGPLVSRLAVFQETLAALRPSPARILDFGCGTGELAHALNRQGYEVSASDFSERMLEQAERAFGADSVKWGALPANWSRLPFCDRTFDAVVASSVLEYVDDVRLVISEFARVLAPAGVLLFTVPDASHLVRRLEGIASVFVRREPVASVAKRIPRIASYTQYLSVSKNRFRQHQWIGVCAASGLSAINLARPAVLAAPLSLLVCRKS